MQTESSNRNCVAHHPKEEVPFDPPAVVGDGHPIGLDRWKPPDSLKDIGCAAQPALGFLRGLVGHIGKRPERGDIAEIPVAKAPHITGERGPLDDRLRRFPDVFGKPQAVRKVVDRPRRDVSQQRPRITLHQARHRFVQCPVPAAADHQFKFICPRFQQLRDLQWPLGRTDGRFPSRFHKQVDRF